MDPRLGETISISAMEFAMTLTDDHVGGMNAESVLSDVFCRGYRAALAAKCIAAWPVNDWPRVCGIEPSCHRGRARDVQALRRLVPRPPTPYPRVLKTR